MSLLVLRGLDGVWSSRYSRSPTIKKKEKKRKYLHITCSRLPAIFALFLVLNLRVRPPTIKVVLPLRKKYQALLACTTSVFMFRNGGAWERGYTETPETWIPPYYGHTAVHGPSGGPNGVHFGVVSLCTCATHC